MLDLLEILTYDMKLSAWQQVMDFRHTACL
jgi:hypothetical protein